MDVTTDSSHSRPSIDVIIKLGGSAITQKDRFETLRSESLQEAAILVEKCLERRLKLVVIHGAGSFGHHQAKQYGINSGFKHLDSPQLQQRKLGFSFCHRSVTKLNSYVVDSMLEKNIPAVPCPPCSSWVTSDREVSVSGCDIVAQLVTSGFVPVLHGDTVTDTKLGGCILSGDTIIKRSCQEFEVARVIFLTDVRGVFDRPPEQDGAVLLSSIDVKEDGSFDTNISTSLSSHDVTGGIKLKIQTAVDIVTASQGRTSVYVCKLGSDVCHQLCLSDHVNRPLKDGTEINMEKVQIS